MRLTRGTKELLDHAVTTDFESGYNSVTEWWSSVFDKKESRTRTETYASNERTIALTEWDYGDERTSGLTSHVNFDATNKRFSAMLEIEADDLEDDMYGLYEDDIRLLGLAAGRWKNRMAADFLANGTSTTGKDGQAFFSTTHPRRAGDGTGASQANLFTSTPLTFDNLNAVRSAMRGLIAPDGYRYDEFGSSLVLVVPPELELVAMQLCYGETVVRSATQSGSGSLFGSVQNPFLKFSLTPIVATDLTESTVWYLADVAGTKPCKLQVRSEPVLRVHDAGTSASLAAADRIRYTVKARGQAVGTRWQKIARCAA